MLVQSALQQHLSHLIAVQARRGRERRRGAAGRRPLRRAARPHARTVPPSRRREAAHEVPLLRPAPPRSAAPQRHRPTRSSSSRCSTTRRRPARRASRPCSCACCAPGFTLTPDNLRITGGERIRTIGIVWCAPADALPPQAEAGLVDTRRRSAAHAGGAHRQSAATSRPTRCASSRIPAATTPPAGLRPAAVVDRVLVQGRVPVRLRLRPRRRSARRTPAPQPDIDYLAKDYQGFRRLMLDRLSLLVAGLDRALGRPISASRWSSCSPTRPTTSPTGRTRSPTRPISPPRASASRCAATRGWSTTSCTKAATRAPSCTSTSSARHVALAEGTPAPDQRRPGFRP